MAIPALSWLTGKNFYQIAPETRTAFAVWMKLKRMGKGLTQQKAAELLGVNCQAYQKYAPPKKANPTLITLKRIERVLNEKLVLL